MKRISFWLGLIVTFAGTGYFLHALFENSGSLAGLPLDWWTLLALLGALLLQGLVIISGGFAWLLLLRGVREQAPMSRVLTLFGLTQPAKYLPGNFGHYAGRTVLAGRCGLRSSRVIFSIVLETSWLLVAAILVSCSTFLPARAGLDGIDLPFLPLLKQAFLLMAAVALPLISVRLLKYFRGSSWLKGKEGGELKTPPVPVLGACLVLYVANFLLMGCIAALLGEGVFRVGTHDLWRVIGIVATAWIAGYLVPGSPAGLGVREAVLVAALGPLWGGTAATGATLLLRLVTIAGDGLVFLIALGGKKRLFSKVESFD
jgi:glycosyltransferase 2 family protein